MMPTWPPNSNPVFLYLPPSARDDNRTIMASPAITTRPPTPAEIARATAAAIPSAISTRPLVGILGVIIGAGLVTLTGRMLSLGLADLKGHLGISYDAGAWLDSAYNASVMFIGAFSVYLGGLLGPRRVLLFAAGIFAATCIFLPFIHSFSLLVAALIVAGLTSGTFYPLTLTFALRIAPVRFLPFVVAFYATFIDGAVNVAPSLYGWYREQLSWHWMFWGSALIAPVMMICISLGIPSAPARKKGSSAPSFVGFLYLSAGLALMLAALQQGQRLDWWRSGVFNALLWSGAFFTLCALVRRLLGPNPLVAFPYLWQWNTVLFGSLLFWFRFTLTFALIGLVGGIVLQGVFTGGLSKPQWILTFSAFFHTVRLFGGTAGAIYMSHFLADREKLHSNLLGLHVSSGNWITDSNIHALTAGLFGKSSGLPSPAARAADLIVSRLRLQAYSLSLIDGFLLIAWSCAIALVLVGLLRKSPMSYDGLADVQQQLPPEEQS